MGVEDKLKSSRALEGIHGVRLTSSSPFSVEEIQGGYHLLSHKHVEPFGENQRLLMQRIWELRPACLKPIHCCLRGDRNRSETVANVLTSLPFIALGLQTPRKNFSTSLYANSLIGVGIASSLYHCSRGEMRRLLRWADYTMIATTTVCLSRAIRNENPKLLMAASAALLPFQPFMVSALHTGMMEVAFAKQALTKPELRTAHQLHTVSSLLGGALFIADDYFHSTPYIHAAWHLAAAVGWVPATNSYNEHFQFILFILFMVFILYPFSVLR